MHQQILATLTKEWHLCYVRLVQQLCGDPHLYNLLPPALSAYILLQLQPFIIYCCIIVDVTTINTLESSNK